jgi:uncharacterized membrane protein
MFDLFGRFWRSRVTGTFLAGLIVLLPIVLTVVIIAWLIGILRDALGPGTFLGELLRRGGSALVQNDTLAFWLGVVIALFGIWLLGAIVRTEARRGVQGAMDLLFARLPVVKSIYNPVSRVIRLATEKGGNDLSGMDVVAVRFGGDDGTHILALLASNDYYYIGDLRRVMVYLPTAPFPMTGGLILVPEENVTVVPGMRVDDLLKVYFSLGALAPESMPANMLQVRPEKAALTEAQVAGTKPPGDSPEPISEDTDESKR